MYVEKNAYCVILVNYSELVIKGNIFLIYILKQNVSTE